MNMDMVRGGLVRGTFILPAFPPFGGETALLWLASNRLSVGAIAKG